MSQTAECCYIGEKTGLSCGSAAKWRICWLPFNVDDYTEACTRHVGQLLTDAPEHRVYLIEGLNTLMS